jgi:hypothetical protein
MTQGFPRWLVALLLAAVIAAPLLTAPHVAHAQFFNDDPDSDFSGEPEDDFFDTGTDEFGEPVAGGRDTDHTEGDAYVDEASQPSTITVGGRQVQLRLASERDVWVQNSAWGAGTGLLIGGWFALINAGSNRETQRSIGVGIVAGTILGAVVGIRYVINPNAPITSDNSAPPSSNKLTWQPMVSLDDHGTSFGVRLTF